MINSWVSLPEDNMGSPLPPKTITLNAAELKQTIINGLLGSIKHHYYVMVAKKITLRKCDETELTVIYHNHMANAGKKQDYVSLSVCLLFGDKQKFQHFLKNFGNEFLININLDNETLLNHKDKNPIDWTIQLSKKQKQITIQNISENITHIISLLDQNAAGRSSPEIKLAREMSQNNSATVSPQKRSNFGLGMHSKNISLCQDSDEKTDKELDESNCAQRKVENSSDESSNPPSPSPIKQIVQKNLPPLKIKIPDKSKAKCEKEKPVCQAKSKKRKKNELENEEEEGGENKGFHIDGNMAKFLEHLDQHTRDLFQSTEEILDENLPIIYNSLITVKSFISLLEKIIKKKFCMK